MDKQAYWHLSGKKLYVKFVQIANNSFLQPPISPISRGSDFEKPPKKNIDF